MSYVDPWSTPAEVTRSSTSSVIRQVMAEWSRAGGGSRCRIAAGAGAAGPDATGSRSALASPSTVSVTGAGGAMTLGQSTPVRASRSRWPGSTV